MSSFIIYDVSVALIGSSIFFAYCLWLLSIIYKNFLMLKSKGFLRLKFLLLIIRVIWFLKIILNSCHFIQNSNLLTRECNKFADLFRNEDFTGFLDVFYMNNSFYWVVFLKWLILVMTESTVMLAASVDINTLQFSLLKKLIKSIDKSSKL